VFRRRQATMHSRLARNELEESLEHLRMAAAHATTGAAGYIAPKIDNARDAVSPSLKKAKGTAVDSWESVLDTAAKASRKTGKAGRKGKATLAKKTGSAPRRRWPVVLGGLLAVGAAIGAAGALVRRRAAHDSWSEYAGEVRDDARSAIDTAKSGIETAKDKASTLAETAKDRATEAVGTAQAKLGANKGTPSPGPSGRGKPGITPATSTGIAADTAPLGQYDQQSEELFGPTGSNSKNGRP
jgi:hypothetical protein